MVGLLAGIVIGALAVALYLALSRVRRGQASPPSTQTAPTESANQRSAPHEAAALAQHPAPSSAESSTAMPVAPATMSASLDSAVRVLELIRTGVDASRIGLVVLSADDQVLYANSAARRLGAVRADRLSDPGLATLARQTRHFAEKREVELEFPRENADPLAVLVEVTPLDSTGRLALQVSDATEAHRVAQVRKDFVANVSHELKTPVGAMAVLAETLLEATDDPASVERFAERIRHESHRLGRLVQELIELSRLQGADPLPEAKPVYIDRAVTEVVDRTRMAAETKRITIVAGGEKGLVMMGSESQVVTALVNLVENALAYSPEDTKITIGTRRHDHRVEIAVSDQGIGIAEHDMDRIFERFYRADPARSRATGGTGLGLAIVKHIASNHAGSVDVWSVSGAGSTFTLRFPAAEAGNPKGVR